MNNRFLYALVVLTMGLYLALDGAYQPAALNSKSVKFIATEIEKVAPESEGTMYEFIEESLHAAGDPVHYFELNFYLHNRLDNFYEKRPSEGFLLIGTNDAEKYLPEFEKEGYQFEEVYESPKRVLRQIAKIYKFVKTNSLKITKRLLLLSKGIELSVFPCFTRNSADWSMENYILSKEKAIIHWNSIQFAVTDMISKFLLSLVIIKIE